MVVMVVVVVVLLWILGVKKKKRLFIKADGFVVKGAVSVADLYF